MQMENMCEWREMIDIECDNKNSIVGYPCILRLRINNRSAFELSEDVP